MVLISVVLECIAHSQGVACVRRSLFSDNERQRAALRRISESQVMK
jgi:hypothetical protein